MNKRVSKDVKNIIEQEAKQKEQDEKMKKQEEKMPDQGVELNKLEDNLLTLKTELNRSLSKNVDTLLEEKHNLNIQLMNQADDLSKTKSEFAVVEAELEKYQVSEQKLQEMFDALTSSQKTSPETSLEMYMETSQEKKKAKPEEKMKSIFYDRFEPAGFVKPEISKAEPKEQVKKKKDNQT
ncbi:hypothetical protein QVD17_11996 [Tagetes erecta]|uniref:Uncharacterized protein n=1 Tax=Tagetes erecta TaxID=13708 RepID=A0AAD8KVG6_TARER|nr:hypothetical protein QVD17_11996 [Tagetes erecta]